MDQGRLSDGRQNDCETRVRLLSLASDARNRIGLAAEQAQQEFGNVFRVPRHRPHVRG